MPRDKSIKKNTEPPINADKANNSPQPTTLPSREGISPEPISDATLFSPLNMPKVERNYTTAGIGDAPPPPPNENKTDTTTKTPPPPTNGAGVIGDLPPAKDFTAQTSEDKEPTAGTQQFGGPSQEMEKYKMTDNYALNTAEDIFRGLNFFLKWNVSKVLHVKYREPFVKYHKATERIAQHTPNVKPSDIKERLKAHNSGIKDKIAMDQEDHDLIVPPAAEWFRDIGFILTPGWKVAVAGGQILMRKVGDIIDIKQENDEFKEHLKAEISEFMDVYETEIKPDLDRLEKSKRQVPPSPPPPKPKDDKTKTKPKKK